MFVTLSGMMILIQFLCADKIPRYDYTDSDPYCQYLHRKYLPLQLHLFYEQGRQHFWLLPLDCHTAETGAHVNGGRSPFISTIDMGGRLCYVGNETRRPTFYG